MIYLNKPYIPSIERYERYLKVSMDAGWITNNGPLVVELEDRLKDYLNVPHVSLVCNGTIALMIAIKAAGIEKNALTTPFTFIATSSAMKWMGINPVFADISLDTFNMDIDSLGKDDLLMVDGVVLVHIYGNPCVSKKSSMLFEKYGSKVVYDASHAFGVNSGDDSVMRYGLSACSLHATKLFHCAEGGMIVSQDRHQKESIDRIRNFGYSTSNDDIVDLGINGKMSEYHAAVGLAMLDEFETLLEKRKELKAHYYRKMKNMVRLQKRKDEFEDNGAYMPIILPSEKVRNSLYDYLRDQGIQSRKYFYPSLDSLDNIFMSNSYCANSRDVVNSILCLPLHHSLTKEEINTVYKKVKDHLTETMSK